MLYPRYTCLFVVKSAAPLCAYIGYQVSTSSLKDWVASIDQQAKNSRSHGYMSHRKPRSENERAQRNGRRDKSTRERGSDIPPNCPRLPLVPKGIFQTIFVAKVGLEKRLRRRSLSKGEMARLALKIRIDWFLRLKLRVKPIVHQNRAMRFKKFVGPKTVDVPVERPVITNVPVKKAKSVLSFTNAPVLTVPASQQNKLRLAFFEARKKWGLGDWLALSTEWNIAIQDSGIHPLPEFQSMYDIEAFLLLRDYSYLGPRVLEGQCQHQADECICKTEELTEFSTGTNSSFGPPPKRDGRIVDYGIGKAGVSPPIIKKAIKQLEVLSNKASVSKIGVCCKCGVKCRGTSVSHALMSYEHSLV
uniref:PM1 protein n=2 Tax=La France disease virus TaxID=28373 RepID=Q83036_9VIRU|nr:pM1 [La France disease virus]prf//1906228B M1 dsRNA ORF [Agaricus bisporus]